MATYNHIFDQHWSLYQKILQYDYMGHNRIFDALLADMNSQQLHAFSFLDIGCGDAQTISKRLLSSSIKSYTGIDLSEDALLHASQSLAALNTQVRLLNDRFENALADLSQHNANQFDIVFSGFALHHLGVNDLKRSFEHIHQLLPKNGCFYLIDVCQRADEDRDAYLDRYLSKPANEWQQLTKSEFNILDSHVRSSDFPSTREGLEKIGKQTGFSLQHCLMEDHEHSNILMKYVK